MTSAAQMNRSTSTASVPAIAAVAATWWAGSWRSLTRPIGNAVSRKANPAADVLRAQSEQERVIDIEVVPVAHLEHRRQRIHPTNVAIAAVPNRPRQRDQG